MIGIRDFERPNDRVAQGRAFVQGGIGDRSGRLRETVAATAVRRLAAILTSDVTGYSRLMGADEEGTLNRLKAHHRELVDPKIRKHLGRIVKTTGDGMLVEFGSVVDAVRCAVEVQRANGRPKRREPEEKRIRFRVGLNLGDVIADGDDIYGDGVNCGAARGIGRARQHLHLTHGARSHRRQAPLYLRGYRGTECQNIAQPVHAYALHAAAVASLPEVTIPLLPIGKNQRSSSFRLAALAACIIGAIAIGAKAWWGWPSGTRPRQPFAPA